jgi:hypothetical protein
MEGSRQGRREWKALRAGLFVVAEATTYKPPRVWRDFRALRHG